MKSKMTRMEWELFGIGVLGAILSKTIRISAPIHELGHLLAAWSTGREASLGGWDYIWINYSSPFIDASGYFFEMIMLGVLSYLVARLGKIRIVAFILGNMAMTVWKWGGSMDVYHLERTGHHGIALAGGPVLFVIFLLFWSVSYRALVMYQDANKPPSRSVTTRTREAV